MDLKARRWTPAAALLVAAVLMGALTLLDAWRLHRIHHWNAALAGGALAGGAVAGGALAADEPGLDAAPEALRFAAAYARAQQGDLQAALDGYRALESARDPRLRRDARFNSGNLYLLESRSAAAGSDSGAGLTLIELAKQSYREVLREDDQDWDARYNLERALRLAPDVDRGADTLPPPPDSRHAPSTAHGVALGLP